MNLNMNLKLECNCPHCGKSLKNYNANIFKQNDIFIINIKLFEKTDWYCPNCCKEFYINEINLIEET